MTISKHIPTLDSRVNDGEKEAAEVDTKTSVHKIEPLPLIGHAAIGGGAILHHSDHLNTKTFSARLPSLKRTSFYIQRVLPDVEGSR